MKPFVLAAMIALMAHLDAGALAAPAAPADPAAPVETILPPGKPVIVTHDIGPDALVITSAPKFAGAISSMRFRGQEYVNDLDHGRLMQGAIAYDGKLECLNPTQGGSARDMGNWRDRSTSRRLEARVTQGREMHIVTRMAYWLRPGMTCGLEGGGRAKVINTKRLSDDVYRITHRFGLNAQPQVTGVTIQYDVKGRYKSAVVEALTIYTPLAFDTFHTLDPATWALTLEPTIKSDEQTAPLILSTNDGAHAIGFVSLQAGATYARFRFSDTNKISLVYRERDGMSDSKIYEAAWIIGTRDEVAAQMRTLLTATPVG